MVTQLTEPAVSTSRPFFVLTAQVPGRGKRRRVSIVWTAGNSMPSRISPRLRAVRKVVTNWVVGPRQFDQVKAEADGVAQWLNDLHESGRDVEAHDTHDTCPRCKGEGHLLHCDHIRDGICFMCDGEGQVPLGQLWKSVEPTYRDASKEDREKFKWVFHVTPLQLASASGGQIKNAVQWIENGPLSNVIKVSDTVAQRYAIYLDNQPKPF